MWWDWTAITLVDSVLFSLLSVVTLYFIGSGIMRFLSVLGKKVDPFSSFDFLQKANFRIFLGFIFLFLFALIFSIFDLSFLISTLLIIIMIVIGFATSIRSFKVKLPKITNLQINGLVTIIIGFVVFFATIFLSSLLITGSYGSANNDSVYHTLIVRIILDHPNALLTRSTMPYASFFINYPSATHVLCAFFVTLLSVPIQKIVMMIIVILPALLALSFYSSIKSLFESNFLSILGLIIGAFFTIGLSWVPMSWGGLPLLMSLYVTISGMGLIFVFLLKTKTNWLNALLLGLIFFIASETYPVALLMLSLWGLLVLSVKFLPKFRSVHKLNVNLFSSYFDRMNIGIIVAFFIPILFSIPYFYSIYAHNIAGVQLQELIPGSSSFAENVKALIDFNWLIDIPALSHSFSVFGELLSLAPYSVIPLIVLLIPKISRKISSVFPAKEFGRSLFLIYFFMLFIMAYLTLTIYLKINVFTTLIDPERVWQHLFIPATMLTAFVIFSIISFFYLAFKRLFHVNKTASKLHKNRILAIVLLALLLFTVVLLSLQRIDPIISEQQGQYNKIGIILNVYNTLDQNDLSLMKWITQNVPSQERILVSAGDSGEFVTAVTQRQTISMYSYFTNYSDLMTILTSNASDLRAVPLMIEYNVSYVYIGSIATTYLLQNPDYRHFNATQFLSTPYFTPAKEFGDAWLFQFNAQAASTAYENYVTPK